MIDNDIMQQAANGLSMRVAALDEAELRRLLGLWVSEIEPEITRDAKTGEISGLRMINETGRAIEGRFLRASPRYIETRRRLLAIG